MTGFQRFLLIFLLIPSFCPLFWYHLVANALIPLLKQQQVLCHNQEKAALLEFKQNFLINCSASTPPFAFPKMHSWREQSVVVNGSSVADYCAWDGVECDQETDCVIGLDLSSSCLYGTIPSNTTLFSLNNLQVLNLADNDFNNSLIPSSISQLYKLKSLNLSESRFTGLLPSKMSLLSSLTILDLSNNVNPTSDDQYSLAFGDDNLDKLLTNLTRLAQLYLDFVAISSGVPRVLTNITSLIDLSFSNCQLYGEIPQGIFQLPHLEVLILSDNPRLRGHLPEFHPNSPLMILDLQVTGFSGELPSSIGHLGHLEVLYLTACSFSGHIPASLGNLTKLTYLDLLENSFSGAIPSSLTNATNLGTLALAGLSVDPMILDLWLLKLNKKLTWLILINMNMGNVIPSNLANHTNLVNLGLQSNKLFGTLPQWFANLTQLLQLTLYDNQLEGPTQPWLSKLVNLQALDLSKTNLFGMFEHFLELPNIQDLYLSHFNLAFLPNASSNISSLSKLSGLSLSSCNLTEFPRFLEDQNELNSLYLDGNHIGGLVPQWFMNATKHSLIFLNLSSNSLTGFEQPLFFFPWTNLETLHLRDNKLRGPLPIPLETMQVYDISNNLVYGAIPKQICLADSLRILDLSNNNMSGRIPPCIGHQLGNSLQLLNLRGNIFDDIIPQNFYKSCSLKMINLSENKLEGRLPRSLANCTLLEVLDLGKNRLTDTFPSWLRNLSALQVLVLRHNSFHGMIRDVAKSTQAFGKLRIIDLSYNLHVGPLPTSYLRVWHAMQVQSEDHSSSSNSMISITYHGPVHGSAVDIETFNYVITIINKGSETLYPRILSVFRVVDFSSNNFSGEIPSLLGELRGLQALNLSNNNFEGNIPSSLSNISDLQSLDLSENMLSGVIPQELSKLTFLEVFNVSHNRLVGSIPRGEQFDTFDNSSYDDNLALCGVPLSKECGLVPSSPQSEKETADKAEADSDWIDWIVRALGCASGFIAGFVIGKLFITDRHHGWFIKTFAKKKRSKTRGRKASTSRTRR